MISPLPSELTLHTGLWASDILGGLIWALGFGIEATADQQKYNFKMNPSNKGKFVNTGTSGSNLVKRMCW